MKPLLKIMRRVGEASASLGSPLAAVGSWAFFGRTHPDNAAVSSQARALLHESGVKAAMQSPQPVWWVDVRLDQAESLATTPLFMHAPLGGEGDSDGELCAAAVVLETKRGEGRNYTLLWTKPAFSGAPEQPTNGGLLESSSDEAGRKELVVALSNYVTGGGLHVVRLWVTASSSC
eukprot:COSAG05_NODE_2265_length_3314_cov_55.001758_3_plen_176_part_00